MKPRRPPVDYEARLDVILRKLANTRAGLAESIEAFGALCDDRQLCEGDLGPEAREAYKDAAVLMRLAVKRLKPYTR